MLRQGRAENNVWRIDQVLRLLRDSALPNRQPRAMTTKPDSNAEESAGGAEMKLGQITFSEFAVGGARIKTWAVGTSDELRAASCSLQQYCFVNLMAARALQCYNQHCTVRLGTVQGLATSDNTANHLTTTWNKNAKNHITCPLFHVGPQTLNPKR